MTSADLHTEEALELRESLEQATDDRARQDTLDYISMRADQLAGDLRGRFRIPLVVFNTVPNRASVDATVCIHAGKVCGGRLSRTAEIARTSLTNDRP